MNDVVRDLEDFWQFEWKDHDVVEVVAVYVHVARI